MLRKANETKRQIIESLNKRILKETTESQKFEDDGVGKVPLGEITSDDITKGVDREMYSSRITNMDSPEDFLDHDFETIGQAKDKEWDKEEERGQDMYDDIYEILAPVLDNIHNKYDLNNFYYDIIGDIVGDWYHANTDED